MCVRLFVHSLPVSDATACNRTNNDATQQRTLAKDAREAKVADFDVQGHAVDQQNVLRLQICTRAAKNPPSQPAPGKHRAYTSNKQNKINFTKSITSSAATPSSPRTAVDDALAVKVGNRLKDLLHHVARVRLGHLLHRHNLSGSVVQWCDRYGLQQSG